jgi:DNA-binding MarR family transcriptional regulator
VSDHLDAIDAQWRRERPDLDVSALILLGRVLRAAHLVDDALADGIAVHGLQPGWFDLLAALRRAGVPYELNPTELTRTTLISSAGMTKRVDRLVAEGLVERRPDPDDRRGTLVRLTRRGKRVFDEALQTYLANEERLLAHLSAAERSKLDALLRRLLEGGLDRAATAFSEWERRNANPRPPA